ncbi:hypothetical protein R1flu_006678 [Riccia fluitans]|uniref:Uncharacterized protein n=1 Tax=Riccia fluitans TaxID=41844 RepID=A0ABD1YZE3_9MARC
MKSQETGAPGDNDAADSELWNIANIHDWNGIDRQAGLPLPTNRNLFGNLDSPIQDYRLALMRVNPEFEHNYPALHSLPSAGSSRKLGRAELARLRPTASYPTRLNDSRGGSRNFSTSLGIHGLNPSQHEMQENSEALSPCFEPRFGSPIKDSQSRLQSPQ